MKKFLRYCILFISPVVAVAVCVEYMLREIPNPYRYRYEWMQDNAENVETLVLGSSHTFCGVHASLLDGLSFNLSSPGQTENIDLFLLKYWAGKYKKLKTVIFPISYFTWFTLGIENGNSSYMCRYYKLYMDCDIFPNFSIWYNYELADSHSACQKFYEACTGYNSPDMTCDEFGGADLRLLPKGDDWALSEERAVKEVENHTAADYEHIETNYAIMHEMATFCKNKGIQLILITTPCWHLYNKHLEEKQLRKMYEVTCKFHQEHDLPYFDYLTDSRFGADDFFNSSHLSNNGALKFTKILNEDIRDFYSKDR